MVINHLLTEMVLQVGAQLERNFGEKNQDDHINHEKTSSNPSNGGTILLISLS